MAVINGRRSLFWLDFMSFRNWYELNVRGQCKSSLFWQAVNTLVKTLIACFVMCRESINITYVKPYTPPQEVTNGRELCFEIFPSSDS